MNKNPLFCLLCLFFSKRLSACLVAGLRPGAARPTTSVSKCLTLCLCAFVPLCLPSCQQGITPFPLPVVSLSVLDAGVTDVLLELKVANDDGKQLISVERDGKEIRCLTCVDDSLFYDENLQPNRSYSYRAFLLDGGEKVYGAPELSITTMDTTSHDFEWETFTFGGQGASCAFYDVAVIDENDIWAVGVIYIDSLSPGEIYNAVHWNGIKWELYQLKFYDFCNQSSIGIYPARTILALNSTDIWISSGSQITHWDGSIQTKTECIPVSSLKLWGFSDKNIYAVGYLGNIAHYNYYLWQKIISGISENIQDIWGTIESETNQPFILCTASQKLFQSEKIILKIQPDGTINKDIWPFSNRKPYSVWFKNKYKAFACGDGIFIRDLQGTWKIFYDEIPYFMNHMRGTDVNNFFVVDDFGYINHFNGSTWQAIPGNTDGRYYSVAAKDDLAVAVGDGLGGRPAVVTILKRAN